MVSNHFCIYPKLLFKIKISEQTPKPQNQGFVCFWTSLIAAQIIGHAFSEDSGRAQCRSGWMDIFESVESLDEDVF